MANFREVAEQTTADEQSVAGKIFQRDGKPYLAADGSIATISVIGSESKRYKKVRAEIQRKTAEAADDSDEAVAASRIAMAAAAVTAWHGWGSNGTEPECTTENVSVLLSVEHILLQVEAGIGRRSDFFGASSSG